MARGTQRETGAPDWSGDISLDDSAQLATPSGRANPISFQEVLDHLPAIVTIAEPDAPLMLRYVSPHVAQVLGFTPEHWLATPDFWVTRLHPDDRQRVLDVFARLASSMDPFLSLDYRLLAREGAECWFRHDGVRVRAQSGDTAGWQSILVETTTEHETARRLARHADLVHLLHIAAVAANESPTIEDALRTTIEAVCTRSGWSAGHAWLRQRHGESELVATGLWYLDDPEGYRGLCDLAARPKVSDDDGFVATVFATGQPRWVADVTASTDLVRSRAGDSLGVRAAVLIPVMDAGTTVAVLEFYSPEVIEPDEELLTVMTQVGTQLGIAFERERVRLELTAFAERLEWSNRELQDFASVASHDLQEPLRKVVAFGDRLRAKYGDQLDAQGSDYLERMQNAARRMQTLIDDLLSYSRVTTKARPFAPVDLGRLVREVVTDLEERIAREGGQVEVGRLPVVDADASQMRQLFQNLIANGLKFRAPDRPPVVRVHAGSDDVAGLQPNDWADVRISSVAGDHRIVVEDNGIGFEPRYAERIFSIFERLHGRDAYEGTGIGLAICRKIVERHRGTLTAEGRPDAGARFIVSLPESAPVELLEKSGRTS